MRRPLSKTGLIRIAEVASALAALPYLYTPPDLVEGEGFEPSKAEPSDLQSDPFDRSGTPPNETANCECFKLISQCAFQGFLLGNGGYSRQ